MKIISEKDSERWFEFPFAQFFNLPFKIYCNLNHTAMNPLPKSEIQFLQIPVDL